MKVRCWYTCTCEVNCCCCCGRENVKQSDDACYLLAEVNASPKEITGGSRALDRFLANLPNTQQSKSIIIQVRRTGQKKELAKILHKHNAATSTNDGRIFVCICQVTAHGAPSLKGCTHPSMKPPMQAPNDTTPSPRGSLLVRRKHNALLPGELRWGTYHTSRPPSSLADKVFTAQFLSRK